MHRIRWYLKRIRLMTPREIMYRIGEQLTMLSLRVEYRLRIGSGRSTVDEYPPTALTFCNGVQPRLPPLTVDDAGLTKAKDSLMRGEVPVAGKTWQWVDTPGVWHRAPDTRKMWPSGFFGSIGYRENNPFGDIRQLWEPARLQQLVELAMVAQAAGAVERKQAARMITVQLTSWVASNPTLAGPHYISAMECGLRIIATSHAIDVLRKDFGSDAPWSALVTLVVTHARFIERRMSLHSSTGNHTVAEAAGLVYAGLLFPEVKHAQRWLTRGTSILSDAAKAQVLPDGGGAEQAFWYHRFNIELLILATAVMKHYEQGVPSAIRTAVERGSRFLQAVAVSPQRLPPIGDSDGGYALSRFHRPALPFRDSERNHQVFPDSGYTVAHIAGSPRATIVFDHGPLGMPPVYGHGHADALSLFLQFAGEDVFLDPGTYTYTGDQDWRCYFRSTRAHNTITVDDWDQARQDGCFLWSQPFRARLIDSSLNASEGRLVAEHDGYHHIGIQHVRALAWVQDQFLLIWDRISGEGTHRLEMHWHLRHDLRWRDDDTLELQIAGGALAIRLQGGAISTHRGERMPIIGWRSPSYGVLEPTTTVKILRAGPLPHTFTTLVRLGSSWPAEEAIEDAQEWMKARAQ